MCDLCLQVQVFPSDPRAVLAMQRLAVQGGDCGPDPGVRAQLELEPNLQSGGAVFPPLGSKCKTDIQGSARGLNCHRSPLPSGGL